MRIAMKKNKILSLLLALLIAIGLWIYVVTTITPEDSQWIYNIPVTFTNEDGLFSDRNLTLTEGRNTTINLKLGGNRQDLLKLNNSNITVTADLSSVPSAGTWRLKYEVEYPETVNSNSISIDARSAYEVEILVDELAEKEIKVRATFQGDVAENYISEPIELEYDTLDISGPQELVDSIEYAQVVLERTNVTKTVSDSLSYTLMDADGNPVESDEIRCNVDKIGVLMQVNMVKEVPLTVQFIEGGGATEDNVVSHIEPATVTIKGPAETLEGLNSISVGRIDLSTIQSTYTETFNIVIDDGLTNQTQSEATVTLELKNLKESTFRVTNLELANKPDNLKATLGTISLQVTLRGSTDVMDSISASNIRAVADLSALGSSTGQFSVPVDIYVDGFSNVGAMGSYSVLVSISEPVESTDTAVEVSVDPSPTTETEAE
jgi:YbbR domain-containing protein